VKFRRRAIDCRNKAVLQQLDLSVSDAEADWEFAGVVGFAQIKVHAIQRDFDGAIYVPLEAEGSHKVHARGGQGEIAPKPERCAGGKRFLVLDTTGIGIDVGPVKVERHRATGVVQLDGGMSNECDSGNAQHLHFAGCEQGIRGSDLLVCHNGILHQNALGRGIRFRARRGWAGARARRPSSAPRRAGSPGRSRPRSSSTRSGSAGPASATASA
jgi:hypothetical protein